MPASSGLGARHNSIPVMVQAKAYGADLDKQVKYSNGRPIRTRRPRTCIQGYFVNDQSTSTEYAWASALQLAVYTRHVDAVQCLLDQGADINGAEPENPAVDVCRCSLGNGPPTGNRSILHLATCAGHISTLRALLERGASLDVAELIDGEHIIHAALFHGSLDSDKHEALAILAAILDHLAMSTTTESEKAHALNSVGKGQVTPLQFTIDSNDIPAPAMKEALTMLVRAGASLETPPCPVEWAEESKCSSLLLYTLMSFGFCETFHQLLDLGADINGNRPDAIHTSPLWQSPLHYLVRRFERVVENHPSYYDHTLPQERSGRHREEVGRLVRHGASLDIQDSGGRTPLGDAMSYGAEPFSPHRRMLAMKLVKTMLENVVRGGVSEKSLTKAKEWMGEVSRSLKAETGIVGETP